MKFFDLLARSWKLIWFNPWIWLSSALLILASIPPKINPKTSGQLWGLSVWILFKLIVIYLMPAVLIQVVHFQLIGEEYGWRKLGNLVTGYTKRLIGLWLALVVIFVVIFGFCCVLLAIFTAFIGEYSAGNAAGWYDWFLFLSSPVLTVLVVAFFYQAIVKSRSVFESVRYGFRSIARHAGLLVVSSLFFFAVYSAVFFIPLYITLAIEPTLSISFDGAFLRNLIPVTSNPVYQALNQLSFLILTPLECTFYTLVFEGVGE